MARLMSNCEPLSGKEAQWLNDGMNTTTDFSLARVIPVLGESIDAGTKEAAK